MQPRRVLYVLDSLAGGGAETSLAELVPALVELGVDVHIAYLVDRVDLANRFERGGATLWPLTGHQGRARRAFAVWRLCRQIRPDVVHTTLFEADIAGRIGARLARTPVVSSIVNEMYGPRQAAQGRRWRLEAARLLDMLTARLVRRFHALTLTVAEVMAPRLRVRMERIDIIPRARDPRHLGTPSPERRVATRAALGLDDECPVLLAVARVEPQKGIDILISAMPTIRASLPTARLLIAGRPGTASAQLAELVRSLAVDEAVTFLGARADVPDLMCAADVLAFPSRWEGFGGTIIEALALECPIVCTDLAVLHEVAGDSTATTFVDTEDPRHWADTLVRQLASPPAPAMVQQGREHFLQHFTTTTCAAEMVRFYESALAPSHPSEEHQLSDHPTKSKVSHLLSRVRYRYWAGRYRKSPQQYWQARHSVFASTLQGVGSLGLDNAANQADYEFKWQQLRQFLDECSVAEHSRLLDAGCGLGYFSRKLADAGYRVLGADFSDEAIAQARALSALPGLQYEVGDLRSLAASHPGDFDVVTCVDVLFHVVDDAIWEASVRSLAGCVRTGGVLVIQEHLRTAAPGATADTGSPGHVRWRSLADYTRVLGEPSHSAHYELPAEGAGKDLLGWKLG